MRRASSVLDRTPSLRKMLRRWNSTVFALRKSALATSRFDSPWPTSSATRRSAAVSSPSSDAAAADPLELVPDALGPEPRADAFECRKRFLERLACRALALQAALHDTKRHHGARAVERQRHVGVPVDRVREEGARRLGVAADPMRASRGNAPTPRAPTADRGAGRNPRTSRAARRRTRGRRCRSAPRPHR